MFKNPIPAIILDCDLRSQEGLLVSFGKRKVPVIALSPLSNCLAFKSRFVVKGIVSPSVEDGQEYIRFLLNLPFRGVLVYAGDSSAELISEFKTTLSNNGYLLNIAELKSLQNGFDKWKCYQYCKGAGIEVPASFIADTLENAFKGWEILSGNCIIKATRLAGGIYKSVNNKEDLEKKYREMENILSLPANRHKKSSLIIQEFIDSDIQDIWCSESLHDKTGKSTGVLCIQKIRTCFNSDGTFGSRLFAGKTIANPRIEELTKKLLDSLNWRGFVHLDWIFSKKANDYLLTDFNPRLPGFSNLFFRSGFDIGYGYYADLLDLPFELATKKCIYFESFRLPGDISSGIRGIIQKRLSLKEFILSYLAVFNQKYTKIFDVFMPEDPLYTLLSWYKDLSYFLARKLDRIIKPMLKHK